MTDREISSKFDEIFNRISDMQKNMSSICSRIDSLSERPVIPKCDPPFNVFEKVPGKTYAWWSGKYNETIIDPFPAQIITVEKLSGDNFSIEGTPHITTRVQLLFEGDKAYWNGKVAPDSVMSERYYHQQEVTIKSINSNHITIDDLFSTKVFPSSLDIEGPHSEIIVGTSTSISVTVFTLTYESITTHCIEYHIGIERQDIADDILLKSNAAAIMLSYSDGTIWFRFHPDICSAWGTSSIQQIAMDKILQSLYALRDDHDRWEVCNNGVTMGVYKASNVYNLWIRHANGWKVYKQFKDPQDILLRALGFQTGAQGNIVPSCLRKAPLYVTNEDPDI